MLSMTNHNNKVRYLDDSISDMMNPRPMKKRKRSSCDKKSVRFAQDNSNQVYACPWSSSPEYECSTTWYQEEDYDQFYDEMQQYVIAMRNVYTQLFALASLASVAQLLDANNNNNNKNYCTIRGIEQRLFEKVRSIRLAKKRSVNQMVVKAHQYRMAKTPESLRKAYQELSKEACQEAQLLASSNNNNNEHQLAHFLFCAEYC